MMAALQVVYVLTLAVWLGETVFLSFVVAPTLFSTFPAERAGEVMSVLFPNYYRVGYVCGAFLVGTSMAFWRRGGGGARWAVAGGIAALMLASIVYAGAVLQPKAHSLRRALHEAHRTDETAKTKAEFDQVHRRAVQLNGIVLLGNLLLLGMTAVRLEP